MTGTLHAVAIVAGVGKYHTADSDRRLEEAEVEVHHRSTLEMAVADVRTLAEIHILQPEKAKAGTKVVSSGEVGIQASAGTGSAVVAAAALVIGTGYAGAEVAGENTSFVAVENTCSVEVVVEWKPRTARLGYYQTSLTRRRDRGRVSVEGAGVVERTAVKVVAGVEPVEKTPCRIGSASAQGLTNYIGSGRVVEAGTWL